MVLECHQESEQGFGGDSECFQDISLLKNPEGGAGENSLFFDDLLGSEHIKTPTVDAVQNLEDGENVGFFYCFSLMTLAISGL